MAEFLPAELSQTHLLLLIVAVLLLFLLLFVHRRRRKDSRYIDPAAQVNVRSKDRVRLVSMPVERRDEP